MQPAKPLATPPATQFWGGHAQRAPYATDPAVSRGRFYPEPESPTRTPFQRDRDRIIHSLAFRRLKGKTQVFVATEGDHFRTRLTHSLEVAQIARSAARNLGLEEDLAEGVALAHDLGHPPFGHAGERQLDACMAAYGGFDHNAQTLRVLTKLEQRYPQFDGLNLAWETLEGVVKHNGPLLGKGRTLTDLPAALQEAAREQDLELHTWSGAEAQVAALADDIAYNNHDIDDGWRAGLFSIDDLRALPFVGGVFDDVKEDFPTISDQRWMAEAIRRLIGARIADMTMESQRRFVALGPRTAADVRAADQALVAFSEEMQAHEASLRRFLYERVYRAPHVQSVMDRAARVVSDLFARFIDNPKDLPESWRARAEREGAPRVICDYIAGMTDAYAIEEHARLFGIDPLI